MGMDDKSKKNWENYTNLSGQDLSGAKLDGVDLNYANLSNANLSDAITDGCIGL